MTNKRVLSKAVSELDKAKAPAKPKDIITDPMGQWKYPGQVTRIPSDNITMQGVNYPVWAQPNIGPGMMMQPGQDYMFPEADYVDEYPQMQKGGVSIPTVEDAGSMNEDGIWVPDWEAIARQAQKLNAKTVKTASGTIVNFDDNWQVKNVDDNPQMKRGGSKKNKKYTRNIMATNKLFAQNYLFKKPGKKQIYDPLADLYQDGGEPINYLEAELTDEEIQAYRDGGYIVEDISVPQLTQAQNGIITKGPKPNLKKTIPIEKQIKKLINSPRIDDKKKVEQLIYQQRMDDIYYPEDRLHTGNYNKKKPTSLEKKIDAALGYPQFKGSTAASAVSPWEGPIDNFRHPNAARYTAEAIKNKTGNIPYVSAALGYLGANALGIGHEAGTLFKDDRDWSTKLREAGEDIYNNAVGAKVGASDMSSENKTDYLLYLSNNNLIPDGSAAKNKKSNMYVKQSSKDKGSYKNKNKFAPGGIVEELPEAQEGKETGVESYTPWQNAPEEYAPYVTNMEEVPVVAEAAPWAKLSNEYEKKNSKQAFIESKKRDYLKKTNKGLSKMAGLSLDNFPKDVASNFADEYEYKKNNYVTKKLGNQKGFNPRRRDEWVDELTSGERNVVANSKYGSKLQPGYWNRALAGVQELGNTVLPGQPLQYNIPGLTKKEQKEMRDSKLSALEMFAPMDIPGAITANYLKNNGISTGSNFKNQPAFYSGEKMSNVTDADAMALNPLNYAGLEAIPELGMNLIKGAKALPGAIKASKESGLLSNAYKLNPLAFKPNPEAYYRGLGKEGLDDIFNSGVIKSKKINAYPEPYFSKGKIGDKYANGYFAELTNEPMKGVGSFTTGDLIQTPVNQVAINNPNLKLYQKNWLKGYKEVPKELPGSPNKEELVDLWRIQERNAEPMAQLAAEGKLGKHFQNEKAINHFKDREEHFGQWFTKDKNDFDFYKADREFNDPEVINLKVPKSKLEQYNQYNKSLSRAPDREFVVPFEEQELYKQLLGSPNKEEGGSVTDYIDTELTPEEIEWYKSQGYIVEELD